MDIQGQLVAFLDADHIAMLGLSGGIDHLNHLLGLAGALLAHDNSNHVYHSLNELTWGTSPFLYNTLPYHAQFFNRIIVNFL